MRPWLQSETQPGMSIIVWGWSRVNPGVHNEVIRIVKNVLCLHRTKDSRGPDLWFWFWLWWSRLRHLRAVACCPTGRLSVIHHVKAEQDQSLKSALLDHRWAILACRRWTRPRIDSDGTKMISLGHHTIQATAVKNYVEDHFPWLDFQKPGDIHSGLHCTNPPKTL